jgi:hypothetical protein
MNLTPNNSLPMLLSNMLDIQEKFSNKSIGIHLNLKQWLEEINIYKLPEKIYQIMYGVAQSVSNKDAYFEGIDVEELRKSKVRKVLVDWMEDEHPDKELANFCDLSDKEAKAIHPQLEWGMYIQLLPKQDARGVYAQYREIHNLPDTQKLVEDVNEYTKWAIGYDPYRTGEDTNPTAMKVYSTNDNDANGGADPYDMWMNPEKYKHVKIEKQNWWMDEVQLEPKWFSGKKYFEMTSDQKEEDNGLWKRPSDEDIQKHQLLAEQSKAAAKAAVTYKLVAEPTPFTMKALERAIQEWLYGKETNDQNNNDEEASELRPPSTPLLPG